MIGKDIVVRIKNENEFINLVCWGFYPNEKKGEDYLFSVNLEDGIIYCGTKKVKFPVQKEYNVRELARIKRKVFREIIREL